MGRLNRALYIQCLSPHLTVTTNSCPGFNIILKDEIIIYIVLKIGNLLCIVLRVVVPFVLYTSLPNELRFGLWLLLLLRLFSGKAERASRRLETNVKHKCAVIGLSFLSINTYNFSFLSKQATGIVCLTRNKCVNEYSHVISFGDFKAD